MPYASDAFSATPLSHSNYPQKKLRIFFPNFHPEVTRSLAISLGKLGHVLILPGPTCYPDNVNMGCRVDRAWLEEKSLETYENIEIAEGKSLAVNPPDVFILWGNYRLLEQFWKPLQRKRIKDIKVVYFTGNGNELEQRPPADIKNVLITEGFSEPKAIQLGVNYVKWIPWIDFDETLKYEETLYTSGIGSYINAYPERFPEAAALFDNCSAQYNKELPTPVDFKQFDFVRGGFNNRTQLIDAMRARSATLHIRPFEPFGYTVLESLAIGRPVFLYRPYCENILLEKWCIEEETAFYFSSYEEFKEKLSWYLSSPKRMQKIQRNCAMRVREIIDNEEQTAILGAFLENLKSQHKEPARRRRR